MKLSDRPAGTAPAPRWRRAWQHLATLFGLAVLALPAAAGVSPPETLTPDVAAARARLEARVAQVRSALQADAEAPLGGPTAQWMNWPNWGNWNNWNNWPNWGNWANWFNR